MIRRLFIIVSLLVLGTASYASNGESFAIRRGVNLSHWLSQRVENGPAIKDGMHEIDFRKIARNGFDHVRLPIDEEVMWNEQGQKNEEAFHFLHQGIRWAMQNDLRVIVDLHIIRSHYFNAGNEGKQNRLWNDVNEQNHFLDLWKELVTELKVYPTSAVAYEIMNEPTAPDHSDWNKLLAKAYQVIRSVEKDRVLVLGSNMWQGVGTFQYLEVPQGDPNILLSCHFYEPFLLSHYKAEWTEFGNYQGNVHYPGYLVTDDEFNRLSETDKKLVGRWKTPWNRKTLVSFLMKAKQVADEKGLHLYCGEFGMYEKAPVADALRWYKDVISVFDSLDIAWAKWDYQGGFGIYTVKNQPKTELIQTILSGKSKPIIVGGVLAYLNDNLPIEERVKDALSRMTLEEKTRLSYADGRFSTPGCARLGIPGLMYSDGPHGVRAEICWNSWDYAGWTNDSCTAFPALTCLASTWNPVLSKAYGVAIGEEALFRNKSVLLGPGVNIYRTPLNGRNFEYLGEDPYLAARMCVPYIQGVQENGVAACVKHYALNNQELWRNHIDVQVSDRALYEIYLPAFKAAVMEGKTWTIMGAYNKVRGTHAAHNKLLNNDILKGEWGFDGCVVTDWGAAHDTYEAAMYGLDLELGTYTNGLTSNSDLGYNDYYLGDAYLRMIKDGKIPMEVVEEKAARVLRLIFRTSMNRNKGFGAMANENHEETAYRIATEGIVLLKNESRFDKKPLLPIQKGAYKRILVVGDNAIRNLMMGGGSSELKPKKVITPLDALKEEFGDCITFSQGYVAGRPMFDRADVIPQSVIDSLYSAAIEEAKQADLVIFLGGLNKNYQQDCEGDDRKTFELPFEQNRLIKGILDVNQKMVLVLTSGNAVDMPWIEKVPSLIQSWYLGSIGGKALADVLIGEINPSGKLPFSYPVRLEDCPAHFYGEISYPGDSIRQEYKEDILVGYRWYDTKKIKPLFPFGYGLSYTEFQYGKPVVSATELKAGESLEVKVTVKNTGKVAGKEIVQLYIGDEKCSVLRPVKELKDFYKVELQPGEEQEVAFTVERDDLTFFDDERHEWIAEPGRFKIYIGRSSEDIEGTATFMYCD